MQFLGITAFVTNNQGERYTIRLEGGGGRFYWVDSNDNAYPGIVVTKPIDAIAKARVHFGPPNWRFRLESEPDEDNGA